MPQGDNWYEGSLRFDVNYEVHESSGKPRVWFQIWCPNNYQKKDAEKEAGCVLAFEAWDDLANSMQDLKKGQNVVVVARTDSYAKDMSDGKKDYRMKLVAQRCYVEATAADS